MLTSRRSFKFKRFFTLFCNLSKVCSSKQDDLTYIVMTNLLGLGDTVGLDLPLLLSPFNIILTEPFFKRTIPEALLIRFRLMVPARLDFLPNLVRHYLFQVSPRSHSSLLLAY